MKLLMIICALLLCIDGFLHFTLSAQQAYIALTNEDSSIEGSEFHPEKVKHKTAFAYLEVAILQKQTSWLPLRTNETCAGFILSLVDPPDA